MQNTFVIASGNKNKIAELQIIAKKFKLTLISPLDLAKNKNLTTPPDVEETGNSYGENARLKAIAFSKWANMPAIADDTGLEVTALDNRPGIYSARYAGTGANSEMLCRKILAELAEIERKTGIKNRNARYACCLTLADGDSIKHEVIEFTHGKILDSPQGTGGFGYDAIVLLDHLDKTLAEIEFSKTCEIGFRAITAHKFFSTLPTTTI